MDEQLTLGEGGNAAAARRGKILRPQAETQALIDAQPLVETFAEPTQVKAPRQAAPPQHLSADVWGRVRAALVALRVDPVERDAVAAEQEQAAQDAAIGRESCAVKVAQRLVRISELKARRKGANEAEWAAKLANYTAAREDSLRIR